MTPWQEPTRLLHLWGILQARILEGLPAMSSSMPSYWVLNRGVLILGWQMVAFVGFSVLSSIHIPVNSPYTCSWSSALTLLKEEEAVPLSLPDVFPLQSGLFRDLTDISITFNFHPWKIYLIFPAYCHWPHCLLRWFRFWSLILIKVQLNLCGKRTQYALHMKETLTI